jgi:hypothetical protein
MAPVALSAIPQVMDTPVSQYPTSSKASLWISLHPHQSERSKLHPGGWPTTFEHKCYNWKEVQNFVSENSSSSDELLTFFSITYVFKNESESVSWPPSGRDLNPPIVPWGHAVLLIENIENAPVWCSYLWTFKHECSSIEKQQKLLFCNYQCQ